MALGSMTQFSAVHLALRLLCTGSAPCSFFSSALRLAGVGCSGCSVARALPQQRICRQRPWRTRRRLTTNKTDEQQNCRTDELQNDLHVLHVLHVNVFANCKVRSSVCCSCSRTEVPKRPFKQNCWLGFQLFQVDHWIHWILFK